MTKLLKDNFMYILLLLLLTALFFMVPVLITYDSHGYLSYIDILNGKLPLSSWDVVRGFGLPIYIFLFVKIFGFSISALRIGNYFSYLILIIILLYFLKKILTNIESKVNKIFFIIIYLVIILFNTITFGYMHAVLTEFIAIPLSLISCMVSYKFLQIKFNYSCLKNYKFYLYLIFYILIFIYSWFLKQPYFTIAIFPLLIVIILSIFKHKSLIDFLFRFLTLIISIIFLLLSTKLWKYTLTGSGVDYNSGRNTSSFINEAFISGVLLIRKEENEILYDINALENDECVSKNDLDKVKARNNDKFVIYNIVDDEMQVKDKMLMFYDGDTYTMFDSIKFILKLFIKHPLVVLKSYFNGYLTSIDIYSNAGYFEKIDINYNRENKSVGLFYENRKDNFIWLTNDMKEDLKELNTEIKTPVKVNKILKTYSFIHTLIFKIWYLFLPAMLLGVLFYYIYKNQRSNKMEFIIILLGFAFLHTLFHVVTGAIIDRYVYVSFIELALGYILLIFPLKRQ